MKRYKTAYEFFFARAGYSYTPGKETKRQGRARCARSLARAEREARNCGITFLWAHERDADTSWMDSEQLADYHAGDAVVMECRAVDESGNVLAYLGGINMLSEFDSYRRVVEAELAADATRAE